MKMKLFLMEIFIGKSDKDQAVSICEIKYNLSNDGKDNCGFSTSENMETLRKYLAGSARECVLKKNNGNSETVLEQLLNGIKGSKDVTNSKSF
jgi:hypothetical protein